MSKTNVIDFNSYKAKKVKQEDCEDVIDSSYEDFHFTMDNFYDIDRSLDVLEAGKVESLTSSLLFFEDALNEIATDLYYQGFDVESPEVQDYFQKVYESMEIFLMSYSDDIDSYDGEI